MTTFADPIPSLPSHEHSDENHCWACGRKVRPSKGCYIRVHEGGSVFLAVGDDGEGRDEAASLGFYRLGPECQRKIPATHRWPLA